MKPSRKQTGACDHTAASQDAYGGQYSKTSVYGISRIRNKKQWGKNMEQISVVDIKVGDNPRKDFGNLEELKASIKEHGIIEPLVLTEKKELIAGGRRLQAAKEIGLKEVPYVTHPVNKDNVAELKLVENIQRKDLTAMEEAEAFQQYIKTFKKDAKFLAVKLGKTEAYVNKRMALLHLEESVQKALSDKKIEIGHATLLAQMTPQQQKAALKDIQEYDLTVHNLADQVRWMSKLDFDNMEFRPYEKEQKTLLESVGQELSPEHNSNVMLKNNAAFKKELNDYVNAQRKLLRDKGIMVFDNTEGLKKKYPNAKTVDSWDTTRYTNVVKKLPNSQEYAVVVDFQYSRLQKNVYELEPKAEKPKAEKKTKVTAKDQEEADKILEQDRKRMLENRVQIYKTGILTEALNKLVKPGTIQAKILTLWSLDKSASIKKLAVLKEVEIDKKILELVTDRSLPDMQYDDRRDAVELLTKFDFSKDWKIDEEFLELHTKDQLAALAKELKIEEVGTGSKSDIISEMLLEELKGKVPKIMKV